MNVQINIILFCFYLCTTALPLFGLTTEEINKLTAHLPTGGYGIRAKLIKEEEEEKSLKMHKIKMYKTHEYIAKQRKEYSDQENTIDNLENLVQKVEKNLKKITPIIKQQSNHQLIHQKTLPAYATTTFIIASQIPKMLQKTQPQTRFGAGVASVILDTFLPTVTSIILMWFVYWKVEDFFSGPAIREVRKLEKKITDLTEDIKKFKTETKDILNIQEGKTSLAIIGLKEEQQQNFEKMSNDFSETISDLNIIRDSLQDTMKTVEENKEITQQMKHFINNQIIPATQAILQQTSIVIDIARNNSDIEKTSIFSSIFPRSPRGSKISPRSASPRGFVTSSSVNSSPDDIKNQEPSAPRLPTPESTTPGTSQEDESKTTEIKKKNKRGYFFK